MSFIGAGCRLEAIANRGRGSTSAQRVSPYSLANGGLDFVFGVPGGSA